MKQQLRGINLKTFVLVVVFVNVPFWILAFFSLDQARLALNDQLATHFRAIVRRNALTLNYGVNHLVMETGILGINSVIRDALRKQNATYPSNMAEVQKKLMETEKIWAASEANPIVAQMLGTPASRSLRDFIQINPGFKRIIVADRFGGTVAATRKTIKYMHVEEDSWKQSLKDGILGGVYIGDATIDQLTGYNALNIWVPIQEEGKDQVIGTIGAIVDISDLFPLVTGVSIGNTGETLLVRGDGTILAGAEGEQQLGTKLPYMDDIVTALSTTIKPDFIPAKIPGGKSKVVAYRSVGLATAYPNLKWWVVVEQDTSEAYSAIDTMTRKMLWAAIVVLVSITVLALYLFTHRRLPYTDLKEVEPD
jgi:hypothetical protein